MSDKTKGERIAKVMARAGVASRRDAEKMILAGRVSVNGKVAASPALDVAPSDKVTLDGKPIDAPQAARLWLYYKPVGLVTSAKDEKGRQTVFDTMPENMPRVMSVGRLDLTSEGLLLLTNDGALKRRLELPSTGWLRKYRVRVNGRPNEATFDPLRRGVTIEGEDFQPMEISLDKQLGANAWLTVGLREGKNREIRRAMTEVGLIVNRLIRVSYGPFRLNTMKPGDIVEVKARVLRDQLGEQLDDGTATPAQEQARPKRGKPRTPNRDARPDEAGKPRARPARPARDEGAKPPRAPRQDRSSPERTSQGRPHRFDKGAPAADRAERTERGDRPRDAGSAKPPRRDRDDSAPKGQRGGPWKGKPGPRGERSGDRTGDRAGRTGQKEPRESGGRPQEDRARAPRRDDRSDEARKPKGAGFKGKPRRDAADGPRPFPKGPGKGKPGPRGEGSTDRDTRPPRGAAPQGQRGGPWKGKPGPRGDAPQRSGTDRPGPGGAKGKPAPRRDRDGSAPQGKPSPRGKDKGPRR